MLLNPPLIYCFATSLAVCSIFRDEHSSLSRSTESRLKKIIREITETWASHDITLISHGNHTSDDKVKRITDQISSAVLPFHPTRYFQTSNLSAFTTDSHLSGTSRTLAIFVCKLDLLRRTEHLKQVLKILVKISYVKHSPRVLLVVISDRRIVDMKSQLSYLWTNFHPYVIALEIPESFDEYDERSPVHVHRYRQHPPTYSRRIYNGNVSDWYTDQFRNISGVELKLCPHNFSRKDSELSKLELQVMKRQLNVSVNGEVSDKCGGMTYDLFCLLHNTLYSLRDHSAPIYINRMCLYVPEIARRVHGVESWGLIIASMLGILIVIMVLVFSTFTNIETFKDPFNIVAVVLGTSLNSIKLPRFVEKTMYLCLVHVATRYTSMLYTELFNDVVMGMKEVNINDFNDLYGLNLTIETSTAMYNFLVDSNNVPTNLMPMLHVVNPTDNATKTGNRKVGHFSLEIVEMKRDKNNLKRTKLCIGSVTIVHLISLKWQYKEHVNDLLWRINDYGYRDYEYARLVGKSYVEEEIKEEPGAQPRVVLALLYGYVVVAVVFAGELVYGLILRNRGVRYRSNDAWCQRWRFNSGYSSRSDNF